MFIFLIKIKKLSRIEHIQNSGLENIYTHKHTLLKAHLTENAPKVSFNLINSLYCSLDTVDKESYCIDGGLVVFFCFFFVT